VLWWQARSSRLSDRAAAEIGRARRLLVSPISFWEIAMLVDKGRIGRDRPTRTWVNDLIRTERIEVAELSPAVAVAAGAMAGFHGDPADRLIVSAARREQIPLVTKDERIRTYAEAVGDLDIVW